MFVVERSATIRQTEFIHVREFLRALGQLLNGGVKDKNGEIISQAAIIMFSDDAEKIFTFEESNRPGGFDKAVRLLPVQCVEDDQERREPWVLLFVR